MTPRLAAPKKHVVLVVDDEPDILAVTKLSLKGLKHNQRKLVLEGVSSGKEAVQALRDNPNIAVVLLDVVMETDSAGLDACEAIRGELDNPFVRILLRTGQPGAAPERETIEKYDIDGYLPKAEMTSGRLFSAVRTAIRAWEQLVDLERHRRSLSAVHDLAITLRSFEPLDVSLQKILDAATSVCPTELALLTFETLDADGDTQRFALHSSIDADAVKSQVAADGHRTKIAASAEARAQNEVGAFEGGVLVPIKLDRGMGGGHIYLANCEADDLAQKGLALLAGHAQNALYAAAARALLEAREGPVFDEIAI